MSKKPKLLVLSTDIKTNQLKPKRLRVSVACLVCRKKKRKCDGILPCLFCKRNKLICQYSNNTTTSNIVNNSYEINNQNTVDNNPANSNLYPNQDNRMKVMYLNNTANNNYSSNYSNNKNHDIIHDEPLNGLDDNIIIDDSVAKINYKVIVERIFTKEALQKIVSQNYNDPNNKKDTQINNPNNCSYDINGYIINLIKRNTNKNESLNLLGLRMQTNTILPPRDIALKLILKTWNYACVLFRFYHRPTIIKILDSLYENNGFPRNLIEIRAEALIYSVLAVGALFSRDDVNENDTIRREYYRDEGLKFFLYAKKLIDFADVSDIYSIQTIFMLTIFLQCSANLKSCYHYIGIALRSVIKEGLYKKNSLVGPTPIEDETKKRLFWSIYKVDIYMNCILGLPSSLSTDKIDQSLPLDVDDEKITANGILGDGNKIRKEPNTEEDNSNTTPLYDNSEEKISITKISSCGMNNEHTKLLLIMSNIYDYTSQLTLSKILQKNELIKNINKLEIKLNHWYTGLPNSLKPEYEKYLSQEDLNVYLKPQKLLYLDFLLTKLTLYKPFFHFITLNINEYPNLEFQIKMSQNCIKISIEIIRLSYNMINENLLNGTYWYSIHTIYYSFACLTIYKYQLLEKRRVQQDEIKKQREFGSINILGKDQNKQNTDDYTIKEIQKVYDIGYKILIELQDYSNAGKRILKVLELIFKQFNEKFLEMNRQLINNLKNFKHKEYNNDLINLHANQHIDSAHGTSNNDSHLIAHHEYQEQSNSTSNLHHHTRKTRNFNNAVGIINSRDNNDNNVNYASTSIINNTNIGNTTLSNEKSSSIRTMGSTIYNNNGDTLNNQEELSNEKDAIIEPPDDHLEYFQSSGSANITGKSSNTNGNINVNHSAGSNTATTLAGTTFTDANKKDSSEDVNGTEVDSLLNDNDLGNSDNNYHKAHDTYNDNVNIDINTIDNPETDLIFNSQNFLNKLLEDLEVELKRDISHG